MKLVIDDATYKYQEIFATFGDIKAVKGNKINNSIVKDADILIVRSRTKVDKKLLQGSSVKFVASTVAGLEHIEQKYLARNNIKFFSAQGCNAIAVAEFVIAACTNLAHDFNFDLSKKTLAIIGVGNIGSALLKKAKLLNIKTILNDPPRQQKEKLTNWTDLKTALSADIISLHVPLTFKGKYATYKLLSGKNFHYIKNDAIVINTARGGIIDESIWQNSKTLANVIDCWENEPRINNTLQKKAYWATPHIAGHSIDAKLASSFMAYEALCTYFNIEKKLKINDISKLQTIKINQANIKDTLNQIYPFIKDSIAIKNIANFEDYRKNYPQRYEWQHFKTKVVLPIATIK